MPVEPQGMPSCVYVIELAPEAGRRRDLESGEEVRQRDGEEELAVDLPARSRVTVWVTPAAIAAWRPPPTGKRGRARRYSDLALETGYVLRLALGHPWRQTEGLLRSIVTLLGVSLAIPDHTTFSRRSVGLSLATPLPPTRAFDSVGSGSDRRPVPVETVRTGGTCIGN